MNYLNPKPAASMKSDNSENLTEESLLEEDTSNENNKTIETSASTSDVPSFGWSQYAERVNGRFAMIGFLAILIIEILSKSNFLEWAGLSG